MFSLYMRTHTGCTSNALAASLSIFSRNFPSEKDGEQGPSSSCV